MVASFPFTLTAGRRSCFLPSIWSTKLVFECRIWKCAFQGLGEASVHSSTEEKPSRELKQRQRQSRLRLSKILLNIKYLKQWNAFLKEVQNHHKNGGSKITLIIQFCFSFPVEKPAGKYLATRGYSTKIQRHSLREFPIKRSDIEDLPRASLKAFMVVFPTNCP